MARFMFSFTAPSSAIISGSPNGRVVVECDGTKVGDRVVGAVGALFQANTGVNLLSTVGALVPIDDTIVYLGNSSGASPNAPLIIMVERVD